MLMRGKKEEGKITYHYFIYMYLAVSNLTQAYQPSRSSRRRSLCSKEPELSR